MEFFNLEVSGTILITLTINLSNLFENSWRIRFDISLQTHQQPAKEMEKYQDLHVQKEFFCTNFNEIHSLYELT